MPANVFACLRALVLAILLIAFVSPAFAGPFQDGLAKFANDDFSDTDAAVAAIAASGNPLAYSIISALHDERLMFDADTKKVYIKQSGGKITDAATGAPVASLPDSADNVRLNNKLRRHVDEALAGLTLLSPDVGTRIAAARTVFKSHEESALPLVEEALAKETNGSARVALAQARAAILLFKSDATEEQKLKAIAVVKARGDEEALAVLNDIGAKQPPSVTEAAARAIASIKDALAIWSTVQNAWYGLSLGSVLLLAAIGLAITFGVMGVINMAHGEMVMLGAYTTFVVQQVIHAVYPGLLDYSLVIAVPLAFLTSGAIGIVIERTIIRFLYGRPLETLLATWGLSLVLQQAVRTIFGATNREVSSPSWMSGAFKL
ncbi:MAG: ABC transporter permease subunit, partial [Bradyrhizobium sp.]